MLLNKFNVVANHVLIVSKKFEHQSFPLGTEDFDALCIAMAEFPSLGFYNGGVAAGASQPHRHLQLVPLAELEPLSMLERFVSNNTPVSYLYRTISNLSSIPARRSIQLQQFYQQAISELKLEQGAALKPYNLLVYSNSALMIPRSHGGIEDISINSLGYAGCFLAKDKEQLDRIRQLGCMELLAQAGIRASIEP